MIGPTVLLAALLLAGCSYGPAVDRSGFKSAALLPDGQTLVVAYHVLRYRPATGIAAFPDGGVPRYLDDRIVLATLPVQGGRPRVLQRLENRGVHGSLSVNLRAQEADPTRVLVLQSDQPSTSSASSRIFWWRLEPSSGKTAPYPDLNADLAARGGRLGSPEFGDVRVLDPDGALLIGAQGSGGDELWLRSAPGAYSRIDAIKHFYGVVGDELYYWSGNEAVVRNWRTGARQVTARYDPQARQTTRLSRDNPTVRALEGGREDPRVAVSVGSEHAQVTLGRRGADGWTYTPVPIDLTALRE